jgi:hypothetical protein
MKQKEIQKREYIYASTRTSNYKKHVLYTLSIVPKMIDVAKLLLNYLSKMTKLINFVYFTPPSKVGMFKITLITFFLVKMDTTTNRCHFYACNVYVDVNMMIDINHYS